MLPATREPPTVVALMPEPTQSIKHGSTLVTAIAAYFRLSTALSRRMAAGLRLESDKPFWSRFEAEAAAEIRGLSPGSTVLDLGGGRRCTYAGVADAGRVRLVAVDISADELALNRDADETCVANVADSLPFADASIDLLLSRTVLEHVKGVRSAAENMARVLRPGATTVHLVPGRYSLFGTAARLLPFDRLLSLLHFVAPDSRGQVEFDVEYDQCHPSAMRDAFVDAGFRHVTIDTCWSQSGYFHAVPPLFLAVSLYDALMRRLNVRPLAAYMIVTAVR